MAKPVKNSEFLASRFWKLFLVTLLFVLVANSLLNFLIDPYAMYGTGLFNPIAQTGYEKKLLLFEQYDPPPNALIVGSSRVEILDPEIVEELTGKRCFVWGVPDAKSEIIYSIVRIALEEFNAPIELLIVGVEPEIFHPTTSINPQAKVIERYTKYFNDSPGWMVMLEKIGRLFSIAQTRSSIASLWLLLSGGENNPLVGYRPDGFIEFERENPEGRDRRVARAVENYADKKFVLSRYDRLSAERKNYWEETLELCRANNIRVYAIMTPVHPRVYQRLLELGADRIYEEASQYVAGTMNGTTEIFRDYSDLGSFGGNIDYYLDGYHMDHNNGDILLYDLLSDLQPDTEADN
jgi:hypothetical protein